ncbi:endopeptidase La [Parabacteroides sp. FAFU027]|uniref:endopeptidase La n=1 Tax=Parabacteroides sp. FAFU027 TaxID=2922715 RepID=UPI001FAF62AB|nr:endopeptidase La [Parabacteroides sp. FAFU027]
MNIYKNIFAQDGEEENDEQMIPIFTEIEIKNDDESVKVPTDGLPILTLRNMVMFPTIALPVTVGRSKSLRLIKEANSKKKLIGVVCQMDESIEEPEEKDLFRVGVIAEILRVIELPDKTTTVILQGKRRFELEEITSTEPYFKGTVRLLDEISPADDDKEFEALTATVKEMTLKYMHLQNEIPREAMMLIKNMVHPKFLIHFICSNLPISLEEKQALLEMNDLKERAYQLIRILSRETQLEEIKSDIQTKAREDLSQQQKEYFLQQQIKTIQEELGGTSNDNEINEFRIKAAKKKWPEAAAETFEKELKKLERTHPQSPDYSMQLNYLQTFIGLPWGEFTKDHFNIKSAQKLLDKEHFGMEKVKERILEHLAVLQLKGDMKSPIICLYGPPGVGKTSLGKSIAAALKRKYVRMSLGGLHDEAEIRGHRRTYIGAMPGRIIQGIQKAGSSNPVFVLDEVDKLGKDYKGDPSAALLEVLDPEQNNAFHDNFLDVDYDLSKVLFIATANNIGDIPRPLLDRMEMIEISGYILEEKMEIARKHLIPKEIANHGLKKDQIKLPKPTIEALIDGYTRESGVRELDKKIAKVMRKVAIKVLNSEIGDGTIYPAELPDYLGMVEYTRDKYQTNEYAGVVTGLAWTAVGGEILFVESSLSKGKGGKLTLTGNLGDVMKESAILALEYIKAHADKLNIKESAFENWNVHVHVPEGAIPKDGPSAGITMATSLVSSFTQRKVKSNLAMTGEITLRGLVLPVGGIKEKILAAKRSGIKEIILCKENEKDIKDINQIYLEGLTFHFVKDIKEVLKIALLDEKVEDALTIE